MAAHLAGIALGHVTREFPNKLDHVLAGPDDARTPRDLHPLFFGSFDWHSCVHGYWTLARLARLHPGTTTARDVGALFDRMIVPSAIETECRYLRAPGTGGFERPYGWAWLLKLAHELSLHEGRDWCRTVSPLAVMIADRLTAYLPKATYPVRTGMHTNTAFALRLAMDYAADLDVPLSRLIADTARTWFATDEACPAWGEPSGEDFLSPCLVEAECMRRVMPADFGPWFDRFLPDLSRRLPTTLFVPAAVSDRSDGRIAHLDGLNLSRAWCFRALAGALASDDPRRTILTESADEHLAAAMPHLAGDYMGEHWLATFAVLAITD